MKFIDQIKLRLVVVSGLCLSSCAVFNLGQYNEYGQYVPKRPAFILKDKGGNIFPDHLDTNAVYKAVTVDIYAESAPKFDAYLKFYPNGRCLFFGVRRSKDSSIRQTDINLNYPTSEKAYYYSPDGKRIMIESFVSGGGGTYVIANYLISDSGDNLILDSKDIKLIYLRKQLIGDVAGPALDW